MQKITFIDLPETVTLKLEGKLAGPWVQETARAWDAGVPCGRSVNIDLCEVTFIDCAGKNLLRRMHAQGARLCASGFLMKRIVDHVRRDCDHARPGEYRENPR